MTDKDKIRLLRVAMRQAANTFRSYEQMHLAKMTDEGNRKAQENAQHARSLELTLQDTSEPEQPTQKRPPSPQAGGPTLQQPLG